MISISPMGGRCGTTFTLEVLGNALEEIHGVWFSDEALSATVRGCARLGEEEAETGRPQGEDANGATRIYDSRLLLEVDASAVRTAKACILRLIGRNGASNALTLRLVEEAAVDETAEAHGNPASAQALTPPVVVNGRIGHYGEVDYYAIDIAATETLRFEVGANWGPMSTSPEFDPVLALYAMQASWFELERPVPVAQADDPPSLEMTCAGPGRQLVAVRSFVGVGGIHANYLLRILPAEQATETNSLVSRASSFDPRFIWALSENRTAELMRRTVANAVQAAAETNKVAATTGAVDVQAAATQTSATTSLKARSGAIPIAREHEPNDATTQSEQIELPIILEGTIERPGDEDLFTFRMDGPARLAFEIETPDEQPARFNPMLELRDKGGQELMNNLFKRVAGDGDDWIHTIEPKTCLDFSAEGEFTLTIRDATRRYGNEHFKYRIMIRPQVPHVGKIEVAVEQVNLKAGSSKKLTLLTAQEEGYEGEVAFFIEGLPPGVSSLAAAEVEPPKGPPFETIHEERFVPKTQKVNMLLMSEEDAKETQSPAMARIMARPVVGGQAGEAFLVKELPIMIVP